MAARRRTRARVQEITLLGSGFEDSLEVNLLTDDGEPVPVTGVVVENQGSAKFEVDLDSEFFVGAEVGDHPFEINVTQDGETSGPVVLTVHVLPEGGIAPTVASVAPTAIEFESVTDPADEAELVTVTVTGTGFIEPVTLLYGKGENYLPQNDLPNTNVTVVSETELTFTTSWAANISEADSAAPGPWDNFQKVGVQTASGAVAEADAAELHFTKA